MLHRHAGHAEAVARIYWCVDEHAHRRDHRRSRRRQTVALRAAPAGLDPSRHALIYLATRHRRPRHPHPIVAALGGTPRPHQATLTPQPPSFAPEHAERGRIPVLVVDEAHLLDHDQLEAIRLLTNHDMDAGFPRPGAHRPAHPAPPPPFGRFAAFDQRIAVRYTMTGMTGTDTTGYIATTSKSPAEPTLVQRRRHRPDPRRLPRPPRAINNLAIHALSPPTPPITPSSMNPAPAPPPPRSRQTDHQAASTHTMPRRTTPRGLSIPLVPTANDAAIITLNVRAHPLPRKLTPPKQRRPRPYASPFMPTSTRGSTGLPPRSIWPPCAGTRPSRMSAAATVPTGRASMLGLRLGRTCRSRCLVPPAAAPPRAAGKRPEDWHETAWLSPARAAPTTPARYRQRQTNETAPALDSGPCLVDDMPRGGRRPRRAAGLRLSALCWSRRPLDPGSGKSGSCQRRRS